jgi:hypothetical protein
MGLIGQGTGDDPNAFQLCMVRGHRSIDRPHDGGVFRIRGAVHA